MHGDTFWEYGYGHTWLSETNFLIEKPVDEEDDIEWAKKEITRYAEDIREGLGDDWVLADPRGYEDVVIINIQNMRAIRAKQSEGNTGKPETDRWIKRVKELGGSVSFNPDGTITVDKGVMPESTARKLEDKIRKSWEKKG